MQRSFCFRAAQWVHGRVAFGVRVSFASSHPRERGLRRFVSRPLLLAPAVLLLLALEHVAAGALTPATIAIAIAAASGFAFLVGLGHEVVAVPAGPANL